jgi:hypothetical protein
MPFYVGKGRKWRSKNIKGHNQWCQNIANKHGFEIEYIFENLTEEQAFVKEREFIKLYKEDGFELTNLTDGGEGPSGHIMTSETKNKIAISKIGIPRSEETKRKLSAAFLGRHPPNFGKFASEETKIKMSIAKKGTTRSEETKAKISRTATGRHRKQKNTVAVIDIISKIVWPSIREAAIKNNIPKTTLACYLENPSKNKTNLRFLKDIEQENAQKET